jgi:DNA-binding response OmpR family regulator
MTSGAPRILVVDANQSEALVIRRALEEARYAVTYAASSLDGLVAIETERPAAVVLEWDIPTVGGAIFLRTLITSLSHPPPVVALVRPDTNLSDVLGSGVHETLSTPLDTQVLVRVLREILSSAAPGASV